MEGSKAMFCTSCGKELKEGSTFCIHCGARVSEGPVGAAEKAPMRPGSVQEVTAAALGAEKKSTDGFGAGDRTADGNAAGSGLTDRDGAIRQIIGKNTDYYLDRFDRIHREGKSRINWASFFFGLLHASYRGVWREWLKKVRIPLIAEFACILLMGVLLFIQPAAAVICTGAGLIVHIWLMIVQILFSGGFDQIYMQHVEKKLEQKDLSADPSVKRMLAAGALTAVVESILMFLTQMAVLGGMLGSLLFLGGQSDIDSLDIDWDSYMEDLELEDLDIPEDEMMEGVRTEDEETTAAESYESPVREATDYSFWEDSYQRCYGPAAYIMLVSVDEDGILFTASIGVSGYAAYVDMREFYAAWTDDHTAVYEDSVSDYMLQITLSEDGGMVIYDSEPPYGGLQLAGIYTRESEADFPDCEYVFFQSSFAYLSVRECEGDE